MGTEIDLCPLEVQRAVRARVAVLLDAVAALRLISDASAFARLSRKRTLGGISQMHVLRCL